MGDVLKENRCSKIGAVDLFCGVGGLTYGLIQSGIEVVAGIDLDESCKFAYEKNNDAEFICRNIKDVDGQQIVGLLDQYDVKVLVGCAPCQPFSSHRKDKKHRNRHKDWGLLKEFGRIVEEVLPDYVSMENVPDITKETVFLDFVATLKNLGYYVVYSIVKAEDYGVPQRRRRVILLASKNGIIKFPQPFNDSSDVKTVRDAIGSLPQVGAGQADEQDWLHSASRLSDLNLQRIQASKPDGTWRDWPEDLQLDCHKKKSGQTYPGVYGRMSWDCPSPTITTQFFCYGTGRFGHPEQNRALTLREGAILQSFPPEYVFSENKSSFSRSSIARHIGNAVPSKLGEVVGRSIQESYLSYSRGV